MSMCEYMELHRYFEVNIDEVASTSKNVPRECMATAVGETAKSSEEHNEPEKIWRRQCGCLKTSDKLKELLKCFPTPPPPPPSPASPLNQFENTCVSAYCTHLHQPALAEYLEMIEKRSERQLQPETTNKAPSKTWGIVGDFVQVVHLSVMATALAFYYIIYFYMQMVYYTLRSALFFHNADGPMKITIGVVTLTSLVVGFNLILRMERWLGISWWKHE